MISIALIITLVVAINGAAVHKHAQPRIIGGEEADIKDFPYQVSLQDRNEHFCGGSIISSTFIVTAAHCISEFQNAETLSIRAGSTSWINGGESKKVLKIIPHPEYNPETTDYDIALLELAEPLVFGPTVQPIKLAKFERGPNNIAEVSGWGVTTENGPIPDNLRSLSVPTISRFLCNQFYPHHLTRGMICAGYIGGQNDACQGDSGGPLVFDDELIGIVSWGEGCARPNKPGVYSNVPEFHEFISEYVENV